MRKLLIITAGALLLAGCAQLRSVTSDVASFGEWPADRKGGTYAFERLPSQQADPKAAASSDALEAAAKPALAKAGFTPAAASQSPDVLVQVGHRVSRADRGPWTDPIWWRGNFGYWRHGPWMGPSFGLHARYDPLRYESEVALLLRDRASGKPLFESRASSEGSARSDTETLSAMFQAALMDFPKLGINPRRVTVMPAP
jgi:hypothetical protein